MQIASVHSGLFEVETKYIDSIDRIIFQSRASFYKGAPDLVLHFLESGDLGGKGQLA